jgi:hypothetical protein
MNARRTLQLAIIGSAALWSLSVIVRAQDDPPVDPRILAYDKGPSTIDVSKYPANIQADYKVFSAKCKKCHSLARPINCELALDSEWESYLKRMMRKAGDFITPDDGRRIYEFVTYDTKIRKKALYDKKVKAATGTGGF